MSNGQGRMLLTAHIARGAFMGALGAITDVEGRSASTTTDRHFGRGVVVIWKLQSGNVHISQWKINTAFMDVRDRRYIEGFVGSTHIARLRREAPIDVWHVQSNLVSG